jgi:hypothetical protein
MVKAFGAVLAEQAPFYDSGGFDVRAIIVKPIPCEGGCGQITFIITWSGMGARHPPVLDSAIATGEQWSTKLLSAFPGMQVVGPGWFQYADKDQNALIIDHWRAQPALWDVTLGEAGGATQAWALGLGCFEALTAPGVWGEYGSSNLRPYPTTRPGLTPPDLPPGEIPPDEESADQTMMWLAGAAVAGYAIYEISRRYG